MNRADLIKEMKASIGTKDPIVFFEKMVDAFDSLFEEMTVIRTELQNTKNFLALAIKWDAKVASRMLNETIQDMRKSGDDGAGGNVFHEEISALKKAVVNGSVTGDYDSFCKFWIETLGWHPFLRA